MPIWVIVGVHYPRAGLVFECLLWSNAPIELNRTVGDFRMTIILMDLLP